MPGHAGYCAAKAAVAQRCKCTLACVKAAALRGPGAPPGLHLVVGAGPLYRGRPLRGPGLTWLTETGAAELMAEVGPVFRAHMFLGMTIFLLFPFSRLVHVWSGLASVFYALRPYQVVRGRRMNVPK